VNQALSIEPLPERAILVGAEPKGKKTTWTLESSVEELGQLARTAGVQVVGQIIQKLEKVSSTHYIGKGKLEELCQFQQETQCNVVIFDDELSPRQQRNLEEALDVKVIDRTALILDIFANRAQTREGQLQVSLAQYQYLLSRLVGQWTHLERLGGGIGTRGPGEPQLETDRRIVRKRIARLTNEIESIKKHRRLYRERRKKSAMPVTAIVGYTNAGKSTLLNALSNADVLVEDKLFATLDPITRRIALPNHQETLLTDTVGFIQKLPHTLVTAFRATLEELEEADLLLHIVDITHENAPQQYETVEAVLAELNLESTPQLTAINKMDLFLDLQQFDQLSTQPHHTIPSLHPLLENTTAADTDITLISAAQGWGLDRLREDISRLVFM
jgi:GTP-binding protein HflX